MPIYEYRRPDGSTFEVQQSFSDDALKVDPAVPRRATLRRIASMIRCAFSPESERAPASSAGRASARGATALSVVIAPTQSARLPQDAGAPAGAGSLGAVVEL